MMACSQTPDTHDTWHMAPCPPLACITHHAGKLEPGGTWHLAHPWPASPIMQAGWSREAHGTLPTPGLHHPSCRQAGAGRHMAPCPPLACITHHAGRLEPRHMAPCSSSSPMRACTAHLVIPNEGVTLHSRCGQLQHNTAGQWGGGGRV